MVSLAAVESVVAEAFPGQHHALVAAPDARKGERLVLVTDASGLDRAKISDALRKRGMSELNLPAEVIQVDAVPLLGTGKITTRRCRRCWPSVSLAPRPRPTHECEGLATWLVEQADARTRLPDLFVGFCEQLTQAGLPICRATLGLETLNPEHTGLLAVWRDGALEPRRNHARAGILVPRNMSTARPASSTRPMPRSLPPGRRPERHAADAGAACRGRHRLFHAAAAVSRHDALIQHVVRHLRRHRFLDADWNGSPWRPSC